MQAYLSIQEISLLKSDISKDADIIFPSLFDIYGKTKDDLDKLIDILYRHKLFNFSNTGTYVGLDIRTGMHFTYDDGKPSITWFKRLIEIIRDYNNVMGTNINIHIVKKDILEHGILNISDVNSNRLPKETADEYIRLYVEYIKKIMYKCRVANMCATRIEPIKQSKYKIVCKNDSLIISKK